MRYTRIERKIWNSRTFQALSERGQFMWLYILSCPHCNSVGYYKLKLAYIAADLNWSKTMVSKYINEVCNVQTSNGAKGLAMYDKTTETIWIRNYLETHPITNRKHLQGAKSRILEFNHNKDIATQVHLKLKASPREYHQELAKFINKSILSDSSFLSPNDTKEKDKEKDKDKGTSYLLGLPSESDAEAWKEAKTPHQEIVDLYHRILCPPLARVEIWGDNEKTLLRARYKYVIKKIDTFWDCRLMLWWYDFFTYISQSRILTGNKPGFDWKADLGWIVSNKGFTRIINGRYHHSRKTKAEVDFDKWIKLKERELDNGSKELV